MKLPEYEWVQFKKAPLRLVIGQVRFTIMPRFEQKPFIAGFQEAIRNEYPRAAREPMVTYQLSPTGVHTSAGDMLWRFSSRDARWSAVVSESTLTLETRGYVSMHDFLGRFRRLLEAAREQLEVTDRLRLGLRYINEVRYPGAENIAEWRTLLNPEFVGFDVANLLDGRADHVMQETQVQLSDGVLAVRHGLLNETMVPPLPQEQPADGRFYLLDLDYYDTTEYDLDISATIKQMQDYNDVIYRFFRWTLGKKLYDYLEATHAQRS